MNTDPPAALFATMEPGLPRGCTPRAAGVTGGLTERGFDVDGRRRQLVERVVRRARRGCRRVGGGAGPGRLASTIIAPPTLAQECGNSVPADARAGARVDDRSRHRGRASHRRGRRCQKLLKFMNNIARRVASLLPKLRHHASPSAKVPLSDRPYS